MRKTTLAVASHASSISMDAELTEAQAISALAALAQSTRLSIFKLLIKHEPVGITAGVIAETIGAPHNTLSSHLAILVRAGLLRATREGRTIVYRSNVIGMQSILQFLVNDCCNGHPELCNFLTSPSGGVCCGPAPTKSASSVKAARSAGARARRK
jgi:ArsR family transcriptional regulator, arsenate/arsenite/antimonite-responsive transcriptional repressor